MGRAGVAVSQLSAELAGTSSVRAYEIRFPRVLSVRMATIVQCLFACTASHPVWEPMSLS
jgi:hypothetical protein